jgi:hypothetical protein
MQPGCQAARRDISFWFQGFLVTHNCLFPKVHAYNVFSLVRSGLFEIIKNGFNSFVWLYGIIDMYHEAVLLIVMRSEDKERGT